MVLATQNPIEQEGTYPLPEAQMDRFLMHVRVDSPSSEDELEIIRLVRGEQADERREEQNAIAQEVIFTARKEINRIYSSENLERYIVSLINATRENMTNNWLSGLR